MKNRLQHKYFPLKFAKFSRATIFTEHLRWLLLKLNIVTFSVPEKLKNSIFEMSESKSVLWTTQRGTGSERVNASTADLSHIRIGNIDWNESHGKETKHIHASAADFFIY